tara:strand:- start:22764 stop:23399 length:636 start_codon:yes stop_codon:yes gene_type:complete
MNDRTCIVTRNSGSTDTMIRFVADPQGVVVADLKAQLPGRGCWVTAHKDCVRRAMEKNLFARALKTKVVVPDKLDETIDALMVSSLIGMMALARKAGQILIGGGKVDAAIRSGQVLAVFHATEAAADGVRKMDQARHARLVAAGTQTASFHLLSGEKLAIVTAGSNVIHLAVLAGQAGEGVVKRARMLDRYRNRAENGQMADDPAKETDTE